MGHIGITQKFFRVKPTCKISIYGKIPVQVWEAITQTQLLHGRIAPTKTQGIVPILEQAIHC